MNYFFKTYSDIYCHGHNMELQFVHSEKKQVVIHYSRYTGVPWTEKCFGQEMTTGNSFITMVSNSGLTTPVVLW